MSSEIVYGGKPLSQHSLWELGQFLEAIKKAEAKREAASKHVKFNVDLKINNVKIPKMELPPPNPEYLKIKNAIIEEIGKRQNV